MGYIRSRASYTAQINPCIDRPDHAHTLESGHGRVDADHGHDRGPVGLCLCLARSLMLSPSFEAAAKEGICTQGLCTHILGERGYTS